jgi:hypothetical protein
LQHLHHSVLIRVASWRGHLSIEIDHEIRGKFSMACFVFEFKSLKLEVFS